MTPSDFSEQGLVEKPTLALLEQLGYEAVDGYTEQFGSARLESLGRDDQSQVVLERRLRLKLAALNPDLPATAIDAAVDALTQDRSALAPTRANREVWALLRDGAKVTVADDCGDRVTETVCFIDWRNPTNNDVLAVSQFWVVGPQHKRRCDIVCFVNGIPLVLLELKASHKSVEHAYSRNLRDYRDAIPQLFTPNALVILSNGSETRVGATFAPWERFGEWKRIDHESELGIVSLETAIHGLCEPERLLDARGELRRLPRAAGRACEGAGAEPSGPRGQRGNARAVRRRDARRSARCLLAHAGFGQEPVDAVLHAEGAAARAWQLDVRDGHGAWRARRSALRGVQDTGAIDGHLQARSSAHLRRLLGENHRYVFSLIHKFRPEHGDEMPDCSEREDIIVITDEAHRTQYSTLALNMRRALPNAGFLGFTGTPLIAGEQERTREVLRDYVSTYNFRDSIEDGATVPLYYENRIPELQITNERFDEELSDILEEAELDDSQERALSRRFATEYQLITRPDRLRRIAADLVRHFVGRGFLGKAMFVAMRPTTFTCSRCSSLKVIDQIKNDALFAEMVAEQLRRDKAFFAVASEELIAEDESFAVEFKSTARSNLRENRKDKRMEDAVVKTIAGFRNTDGGTLFIGVDDARTPIGLEHELRTGLCEEVEHRELGSSSPSRTVRCSSSESCCDSAWRRRSISSTFRLPLL